MSKAKLIINELAISYIDNNAKTHNKLYDIVQQLSMQNIGSKLDIERADEIKKKSMEGYYVVFEKGNIVSLIYTYLENRTMKVLSRIPKEYLKSEYDTKAVKFQFKLALFCGSLHVLKLNANCNKTYALYRVSNDGWAVTENGAYIIDFVKAALVKQTTLAEAWDFVTHNIDKTNLTTKWAICTKDNVVLFLI